MFGLRLWLCGCGCGCVAVAVAVAVAVDVDVAVDVAVWLWRGTDIQHAVSNPAQRLRWCQLWTSSRHPIVRVARPLEAVTSVL